MHFVSGDSKVMYQCRDKENEAEKPALTLDLQCHNRIAATGQVSRRTAGYARSKVQPRYTN